MMRSVLAVLAGILALSLTSFAIEWATDAWILQTIPDALSKGAAWPGVLRKLFMSAYTTLCVACGGYVTALVARRSEVRHAVIMGAIQMAMTAWAMVEFRDKAPLWSWIAGIALTVPAAWCGGMVRAKQARAASRSRGCPDSSG